MAEAFARAYGGDVLEPHSAGIRPAASISRRTNMVMQEKGVSLAAGYSTKSLSSFNLHEFDLIVNLCDYSLPDTSAMVLKRVLRDLVRATWTPFATCARTWNSWCGF